MTTSITRYGRVRPGFFRLSTLAAAVLCSTLAGPSMARETDEARVDALLKKMTLDDKFNLIRGMTEADATNQGQAGYLPGVPRLGVPALRMAEPRRERASAFVVYKLGELISDLFYLF